MFTKIEIWFTSYKRTIYGSVVIQIAKEMTFLKFTLSFVTEIKWFLAQMLGFPIVSSRQAYFEFYYFCLQKNSASLCGIIHLVRTQNFPKANISNPLIWTRTCAYQGVRNVSFSDNIAYSQNKWMFSLWFSWLWTCFYLLKTIPNFKWKLEKFQFLLKNGETFESI